MFHLASFYGSTPPFCPLGLVELPVSVNHFRRIPATNGYRGTRDEHTSKIVLALGRVYDHC